VDVDFSLALENYSLASAHYSLADIAKGWRADAFKEIGKLYIERSRRPPLRLTGPADDLNAAFTYLRRAREEYQSAIPESESDRTAHLREVQQLLTEIAKDSRFEGRTVPLPSP
jgi:hypothetical protein